jgi:hypothetical protein
LDYLGDMEEEIETIWEVFGKQHLLNMAITSNQR